ncbi:arsenic resistance protein [Pseudomonas sp. S 311-6]|uniref:arsenic resistance protein n=1 Tax=Kerstersia gyiorum TaxID=206506 RepID=UPI002097F39D|nr:arsenic resistance protein [Pseudomonas sp. S 311-6]
MLALRDFLERHQVPLYFCAVLLAAALAIAQPAVATSLEPAINPALALMLYLTFFQVPLTELKRAFGRLRFLAALLLTNFLLVPALVAGLLPLLPPDPLLRLGVLMVLLCPCIDYVVTFSHLGRGDARLLLAATPMLLVVQMLLLPAYLGLFLGSEAALLVRAGPFLDAFLWLILVPLLCAAVSQAALARAGAHAPARQASRLLGLLPVPATALVLFIVIAAVVPQLGLSLPAVRQVVPVYIAFALCAPALGWLAGRLLRLPPAEGRALAFSAGTRNSLVILPLVLAIPGALPLLPAVVLTQTIVELLGELLYIRLIPLLGRQRER